MPRDAEERKVDEMPTEETNTTQDAEPTNTQTSETPVTWEAFLEKQPEEVKNLYKSHSEGLLNTVKATREERDSLSKQIKQLAKEQKEGSEAKSRLDAITAQLEIAERRAAFVEDAIKPEIECRNPGAAWVIAKASDLFDKKGAPDWKAIRAAAPELFGKVIANANAGNGTQTPPAKTKNMNDFIRSKGRS